ncbi:MAG TPA: outer membrane beta-barrel protein, partial [Methylocystis sp.]|nr:outer membrane beta-barrel protein [Methylocystis sp.]
VSGYVAAQTELSDRLFLRGTTGVQYIAYDSRPIPLLGLANLSSANAAGQNGLSYQASLRGGVWLTPQLYGFVEPGADLRFYEYSAWNTNGYRVTAGVGSDLISLFRGEIYGGYQTQASAHGYFGTASSPAFGARVFYYPTPYVTLVASLDQTLTAAPSVTSTTFGVPTPTLSVAPGVAPNAELAASSKTLQARIQGDYALSQYWTAYVRGGYGETTYSSPWSKQTMWAGGAGLNYNVSKSVSVTLEYQFARTFATNANLFSTALVFPSFSNIPSGYAQNVASAGFTYRY